MDICGRFSWQKRAELCLRKHCNVVNLVFTAKSHRTEDPLSTNQQTAVFLAPHKHTLPQVLVSQQNGAKNSMVQYAYFVIMCNL